MLKLKREWDNSISPAYVVALVVFLIVLLPKLPPDDLLRHLSAYRYDYDYRKMFLYSYAPSFDFYLFFDHLAAAVRKLLGDYAFVPFQVLAVVLYGVSVNLILRELPKTVRALLVAAVLFVLYDRMLVARPTVFASGLFLLAYALRDRDWKIHLPIAVFMPVLYYLWFIYAVPLLVFRSLRKYYLFSLLFGLAFWLAVGGTEYFDLIRHILTAKSNRLLQVSEGQNWAAVIFSPAAACLIPALLKWREDLATLTVIGWFLLANQVRYEEVLVPLWLSYARFFSLPAEIDWRVSVPLLLFLISPYSVFSMPTAVGFDRPVKVAYSDMPEMYRGVYFSTAPIQVVPSMEIGWMDRKVQEFLKELHEGTLDCKTLKELGFDYVVENTLNGTPPACVELERISRNYRVWRVLNSEISNSR